jgi:hypothetical protein
MCARWGPLCVNHLTVYAEDMIIIGNFMRFGQQTHVYISMNNSPNKLIRPQCSRRPPTECIQLSVFTNLTDLSI